VNCFFLNLYVSQVFGITDQNTCSLSHRKEEHLSPVAFLLSLVLACPNLPNAGQKLFSEGGDDISVAACHHKVSNYNKRGLIGHGECANSSTIFNGKTLAKRNIYL
jgi:hypothetical protein